MTDLGRRSLAQWCREDSPWDFSGAFEKMPAASNMAKVAKPTGLSDVGGSADHHRERRLGKPLPSSSLAKPGVRWAVASLQPLAAPLHCCLLPLAAYKPYCLLTILILIVPKVPIVTIIVSLSVPGCLHRRAIMQSGIEKSQNDATKKRHAEFFEKEFYWPWRGLRLRPTLSLTGPGLMSWSAF